MLSLAAIQLCTKRRFISLIRLLTFRKTEKRSRKSREKQKTVTNVMLTGCTKARSIDHRTGYVDDVYVKDLQSNAVSNLNEKSEYIHQSIPLGNITNATAGEQGYIATAQVG